MAAACVYCIKEPPNSVYYCYHCILLRHIWVNYIRSAVFTCTVYQEQSFSCAILYLDLKGRCFELWCWRRLSRAPWTARRSNQSILKEISPGCSLQGLMLKLKLQRNPRADLLQNGLVGSPCSPRGSRESSPTPQFKSINSSALSFLHSPTLTSIHDHWKNHSLD